MSRTDRRLVRDALRLGGLTVAALCNHRLITFRAAAATLFAAERQGLLVRAGGARGQAITWRVPSLPLADGGSR